MDWFYLSLLGFIMVSLIAIVYIFGKKLENE